MIFLWRDRGWVAPCLAVAGLFAPILALRQTDTAVVDGVVALAMALAAVVTFWLGLRWNRGRQAGERSRHSFWFVPLQFWAIPMMLFAILVGTHVIRTSTEPGNPQTLVPASRQK